MGAIQPDRDYSQANDLAARMPEKLKQMQAIFSEESAKYGVLPLDNDSFARALAARPSATTGKTIFTYTGVNAGINSSNAPNILGRSYMITAEVEVPQGGGDGMLVTMGGRWGGYGLYLLKGKPVFHYNMLVLAQYHCEGQEALTPGKHTIVFDYTYDGPGVAKGGTGVLKVDGKVVATQKQPNSIAFLQVADETFDVRVDTRTGVNDKDYQVPFAFNGKIDQLTVKLGPMQLTENDQRVRQLAFAVAND
jgi:arylsulfatase